MGKQLGMFVKTENIPTPLFRCKRHDQMTKKKQRKVWQHVHLVFSGLLMQSCCQARSVNVEDPKLYNRGRQLGWKQILICSINLEKSVFFF